MHHPASIGFQIVKARPTALIIDDDLDGLMIFGEVLRRQGFEVLTAGDGRTGVAVASRGDADVVVLDLRLPDLNGLDALRLIRRAVRTVPVVMMTAYPTTTSVVQAMRLGAVDYLEKPLTDDDLCQAVRAALDSTTGPGSDSSAIPARHAAARWADAVASLCDAPEDPRTIRLWGRHIGASPGSLRNWCRVAGVSSKRSLNMARMIRAVLSASSSDRPEDLFNVTDRRTLARLLTLGDPEMPARFPHTMDEFFRRQRWISDPLLLEELKRAIVSRGAEFKADEKPNDH